MDSKGKDGEPDYTLVGPIHPSPGGLHQRIPRSHLSPDGGSLPRTPLHRLAADGYDSAHPRSHLSPDGGSVLIRQIRDKDCGRIARRGARASIASLGYPQVHEASRRTDRCTVGPRPTNRGKEIIGRAKGPVGLGLPTGPSLVLHREPGRPVDFHAVARVQQGPCGWHLDVAQRCKSPAVRCRPNGPASDVPCTQEYGLPSRPFRLPPRLQLRHRAAVGSLGSHSQSASPSGGLPC